VLWNVLEEGLARQNCSLTPAEADFTRRAAVRDKFVDLEKLARALDLSLVKEDLQFARLSGLKQPKTDLNSATRRNVGLGTHEMNSIY
jgi:hypothetical protein